MKVGDRVKVIYADGDDTAESYIGDTGEVVSIDSEAEFPIKVKFIKDSMCYYYNEEELMLLPPTTNQNSSAKLHYSAKSLLNLKEENMNDDLERVIREGNMAMKLVGSVKASSTTIAYTEDITSTLGTLKKKDKRVGFVSTPLKSTI